MKGFGFFKGLPYKNSNENFDDYKMFKNTISKEKIIKHLESNAVKKWYAGEYSKDIFTGETIYSGVFEDGEFVFPFDFLHYYKNYDIGIPYDYEEYLKGIIDY